MNGGNYIGLEGVENARELGGYVMEDGRVVRKGVLLRSGKLASATADDKRRLREEFHLKRIFDFRTELESHIDPDCDIQGCTNTVIPIIDPDIDESKAMPEGVFIDLEGYLIEHACDPLIQRLGRELYPEFIYSPYTRRQYGLFLRGVLEAGGSAVLWHCSQGKDRTGLAAAFVLACLGASRDTIIEDFDRSNESYRETVERVCSLIRSKGWGEEEESTIHSYLGANTGNFIRTLDMIERDFGSLREYIAGPLGFSASEQSKLRKSYLDL